MSQEKNWLLDKKDNILHTVELVFLLAIKLQ